MNNPPALVKLTLEAVMSMLNSSVKAWEWKEVKTFVGKADFIKQVLKMIKKVEISIEKKTFLKRLNFSK